APRGSRRARGRRGRAPRGEAALSSSHLRSGSMYRERMRSRHGSMVRWLCAGLCLASSIPARAADPPEDPQKRAREAMLGYFWGEQREAWVFVGFGLVSLGAGAGLISRSDPFPRSTGITLASISLIQSVSAIVYFYAVEA